MVKPATSSVVSLTFVFGSPALAIVKGATVEVVDLSGALLAMTRRPIASEVAPCDGTDRSSDGQVFIESDMQQEKC